MKFGSVCSGIEAASVAWNSLGWEAAWFSEIESFPSQVLAHHYPDVVNLGDMTKLPEMILNGEIEAPDLLCGGTPCQAFSVAGNRQSLDDARGNLTLTFCEIANALDARRDIPAIIFWENVPGVLNTKDNAFGCFLAELAGEDMPLQPSGKKWTNAGVVLGSKRAIAWRVLDAQYFGLAQRRKRVFVVASAREGFDPAKILFESEGLRRDTAPSRKAGETTPTLTKECTGVSRTGHNEDGWYITEAIATGSNPELMATLCAKDNEKWGCNQWVSEGKAILQPAYGIQGNMIGRSDTAGPQGSGISEDVSFTLTKADQHGVVHPIGVLGGQHPNAAVEIDMSPTLTSAMGIGGGHIPIFCEMADQNGVVHPVVFRETSDCLTSAYATKWNGNASADNGSLFAYQNMAVRRLTPKECERLQGFPDGYTDIKPKGKDTPDGPRYKALGNSWAVPVVRWIGERICYAITNN